MGIYTPTIQNVNAFAEDATLPRSPFTVAPPRVIAVLGCGEGDAVVCTGTSLPTTLTASAPSQRCGFGCASAASERTMRRLI